MRILMVPSDYTFFNVGDIAMIQAALERLGTLWPSARIQVLTEDPVGLAFHCPRAEPLIRNGWQDWMRNGCLLGDLDRSLPPAVAARLFSSEHYFRRNWSTLTELLRRATMRPPRRDASGVERLLEALAEADLVVVAGMGGITDWFEEYALELLDMLWLAIQHGKPTAMLGQGIGPLRGEVLWNRARQVLPRIHMIALRERRVGEPLLAALGVAPDRVVTTGDDAIELAYRRRPACLGNGLGVNLRIGWYSGIGEWLTERLRPVLQNAARAYDAPLVPVPISRTPGEADAVAIRQLVAEYPHVLGESETLTTPLKVIEQVQRCRLVVTGSYHAATFALAQGIPAIGLVKSSYYAAKFEGLAEQFGEGCDVVFLDDLRFTRNLTAAIERAWAEAEQRRPCLLESAARQIELG